MSHAPSGTHAEYMAKLTATTAQSFDDAVHMGDANTVVKDSFEHD
jgi:hypothetical protein